MAEPPAAGTDWRAPRAGRPASRSGPVPGSGRDLMPIRAASRAAAVRDETPILDSTADTWKDQPAAAPLWLARVLGQRLQKRGALQQFHGPFRPPAGMQLASENSHSAPDLKQFFDTPPAQSPPERRRPSS